MEHPLIGDLNNLTLEELNTQISDLYRKLNIATQSGNAHLCNQLRMALESYTTKYQHKLQESTKSHNFDDKIKIS
jgi:hypothetical protein